MAEGKGPGFFTGLFIGGFVGAAFAFLVAPRSGEQTREMLLERSGELRGVAEELSALARAGADELLQAGKTTVSEQRSRVEQAIRAGREAADQTTTEMLSDLDKAQHQGEAS